MKVLILYRPKSEYASQCETFAHDYQSRHGSKNFEMVHVDDRQGLALASLYGIMDFPAILALAQDGRLLQMWQGRQLPLIDDVAAYVIRA